MLKARRKEAEQLKFPEPREGLPEDPRPFLGLSHLEAAARVQEHLSGRCLLAVVGRGGVGKSTVVGRAANSRWARQWFLRDEKGQPSHRRFWVDLEDCAPGRECGERVAHALARKTFPEALARLRAGPCLLVLDNADSAFEAGPVRSAGTGSAEGAVDETLAALVDSAAHGASVVITRRKVSDLSIGRPWTDVIEVSGFDRVVDANELFLTRAPRFVIDEQLSKVVAACDGLPQAVTLLSGAAADGDLEAVRDRVASVVEGLKGLDFALPVTFAMLDADDRAAWGALSLLPSGLAEGDVRAVLAWIDGARERLIHLHSVGVARRCEAGVRVPFCLRLPPVAAGLSASTVDALWDDYVSWGRKVVGPVPSLDRPEGGTAGAETPDPTSPSAGGTSGTGGAGAASGGGRGRGSRGDRGRRAPAAATRPDTRRADAWLSRQGATLAALASRPALSEGTFDLACAGILLHASGLEADALDRTLLRLIEMSLAPPPLPTAPDGAPESAAPAEPPAQSGEPAAETGTAAESALAVAESGEPAPEEEALAAEGEEGGARADAGEGEAERGATAAVQSTVADAAEGEAADETESGPEEPNVGAAEAEEIEAGSNRGDAAEEESISATPDEDADSVEIGAARDDESTEAGAGATEGSAEQDEAADFPEQADEPDATPEPNGAGAEPLSGAIEMQSGEGPVPAASTMTPEEIAVRAARMAVATRIAALLEDQRRFGTSVLMARIAVASLRDGGDDGFLAEALCQLGRTERFCTEYRNAGDHLHEALERFESRGDGVGQGRVHFELGLVELELGNLDGAELQLQAALRDFGATSRPVGEANASLELVRIHLARGRFDQAEERLDYAIRCYEQAGDSLGYANASLQLGQLELARGRVDDAERRFVNALDGYEQAADKVGFANACLQLGQVELARGRFENAERRFGGALAGYEVVGEALGIANVSLQLGQIDLARGRWPQAQQRLQQALSAYEQFGDRIGVANATLQLSQVALGRGVVAEADQMVRTAQQAYDEIGDVLGSANARQVHAIVCQAEEQASEALVLFAEAAQLYDSIGRIANAGVSLAGAARASTDKPERLEYAADAVRHLRDAGLEEVARQLEVEFAEPEPPPEPEVEAVEESEPEVEAPSSRWPRVVGDDEVPAETATPPDDAVPPEVLPTASVAGPLSDAGAEGAAPRPEEEAVAGSAETEEEEPTVEAATGETEMVGAGAAGEEDTDEHLHDPDGESPEAPGGDAGGEEAEAPPEGIAEAAAGEARDRESEEEAPAEPEPSEGEDLTGSEAEPSEGADLAGSEAEPPEGANHPDEEATVGRASFMHRVFGGRRKNR